MKNKEEYERTLEALDKLFDGLAAYVAPKMKQSVFCVAMFDEHADLFLSLQLGLALVFEKPLVVLALNGTPIPPKVRQVADYVIEGRSMKDEEVRRQFQEAVIQVLGKTLGGAVT